MSIKILRRGSKGLDVTRWQHFLIGRRHYSGRADGDFGPKTEAATKAFQRAFDLSSDGIVGPATLGQALLLGFDAGFVDKVEPETNPILVGASELRPVGSKTRERLFGGFDFEAAPTRRNPEAIRILSGWEKENIKVVTIPQLKGVSVFGKPSRGRMHFHTKAIEQLRALWEAWESAGLLHLVRSYAGSYNPRFVRGSRTTLSNHAYGSAFDINAEWNRLGAIPVLEGREGSVRELVPIANDFGFYWGGHFKKRSDGMHFEVAKIL